ncbi:acyltransferase family protein [Pseudonocardia sp. TRM90224]|uniref:acyltransferase family protein n=1 Tax=Pseudonocardia sp. TRM90224 TaxID=2812678 RepID=UPI001E4B62FC|nr:acyltransferase [Pseudonocardia sp. TRM90224]
MTKASPRTTPSGERATFAGEIRGLTGLRIVAAAWVVVFHFHFTPLPGVAEVVGVVGPLITSGALGVDLFFVLSGFVIAHTYLDKLGPALRVGATARFGWARAGRIWPVYVVVFHLFGVWLLARTMLGADGEIAFQAVQPVLSVGEWLQQLFMIQLWDQPFFDGASWVGATWSISAEWLAYLLFPVAALAFYRMRRLPAAVLVLAALVLMAPMAAAYLTAGHPYYPWSWLVRILCGFAAGVFMLMAVRRMRWTSRVRRGASVLAVVIPGLIAVGLLLGELLGPGRGGAVIVLFPLLVATIAVADRGPVMLLSSRAANYGGRLSYSLYLVHIPVFEVFWLALRRFEWLRPDSVLTHVVALGVLLSTLLVAAIAFRLVEEPSRLGMRRMAQKREPVVPVVSAQRVDLVASFRAARELGPRHASVPGRQPKLAAALVQAQRRRPVHGSDLLADLERAGILRNGYLHTP